MSKRNAQFFGFFCVFAKERRRLSPKNKEKCLPEKGETLPRTGKGACVDGVHLRRGNREERARQSFLAKRGDYVKTNLAKRGDCIDKAFSFFYNKRKCRDL